MALCEPTFADIVEGFNRDQNRAYTTVSEPKFLRPPGITDSQWHELRNLFRRRDRNAPLEYATLEILVSDD